MTGRDGDLRVMDLRMLILYVINVLIICLFVMQLFAVRETNSQSRKATEYAMRASSSSVDNGVVIDRVEQLIRLLRDCQTPKGECFKAQAVQRSEQAGTINAFSIAGAVCADRPGSLTSAEMRVCIEQVIETGESPGRTK